MAPATWWKNYLVQKYYIQISARKQNNGNNFFYSWFLQKKIRKALLSTGIERKFKQLLWNAFFVCKIYYNKVSKRKIISKVFSILNSVDLSEFPWNRSPKTLKNWKTNRAYLPYKPDINLICSLDFCSLLPHFIRPLRIKPYWIIKHFKNTVWHKFH